MQTPILCERCKEPVDAYARADGGGCVIVDRAPHGLGKWALFVRVMLKVVPNNEPAVDGESVNESKLGGMVRYRAHDDGCTKIKPRERPLSQERTKRTPIRERRNR